MNNEYLKKMLNMLENEPEHYDNIMQEMNRRRTFPGYNSGEAPVQEIRKHIENDEKIRNVFFSTVREEYFPDELLTDKKMESLSILPDRLIGRMATYALLGKEEKFPLDFFPQQHIDKKRNQQEENNNTEEIITEKCEVEINSDDNKEKNIMSQKKENNMEFLFEQFEKKSREVEQVLKKSIELVQERKSPDVVLRAEIDTALQDLRALYDEIALKLPVDSRKKLPSDASVKEMEEYWQNSIVSKQLALKAILSEFIRVYSDEERYRDAVKKQIADAIILLNQINGDDKAQPDVGPYALFLECVNTDLNSNIELSNKIEDEGIPGFTIKALMGLQKKKYYVRQDVTTEEIMESITVKPAEFEQMVQKMDEDKETSETVTNGSEDSQTMETAADPEDSTEEAAPENEEKLISPVKPLRRHSKMPSRKEFEDIADKYFPIFHILGRNLGVLQLASEEMIAPAVRNAFSPEKYARINLAKILNALETKGYLASYKINDNGTPVIVYCQTEQFRTCMKKDNYRQLITSREPGKERMPFAVFVAKDQVSGKELLERYRKAEAVVKMFDYHPNGHSLIKSNFCLWDEEKGYHYSKLTFYSGGTIDVVVVPHHTENDPIRFPTKSSNMLIVDMTGNLPDTKNLELGEARRIFCINNNAYYELIDGAWIEFDDKVDDGHSEEVNIRQKEPRDIGASKVKVIREQPIEKNVTNLSETVDKTVSESEEPTAEIDEEGKQNAALNDFLNTVYRLFGQGKFYAGMALLHGLEQEDDNYHLMAERYGFALGDPYLELDNRFANLQSVFGDAFGQETKYDLLAYAAYLRMYCSPTAGFDPYSIKDISYLKDNIACATFTLLNNMLNEMARYLGRFQHGLDDKTIASAVLKRSQLDRIPEFSQKAKEIQDAKLYKQSRPNKRVNKTRWQLFGENSDIQAMLSIVAADNRSELKTVKAFLNDKGINGIVEDEIIDLIMDSAWDDNADAAEKKKMATLTGAERSCLTRQLREILECLNDWAHEVESGDKLNSSETHDTLALIQKCLSDLTDAIKDVQKKTKIILPADEAASYVILEKTLLYIKDRLEGKITQEKYRRNFYIDLMKAPFIALDEERLPIIESKEEQVCDLDFCKRAAMYADVPARDWHDVVKKIFTYSQDRKCFDFGNAEIIEKYLEETGQKNKFGEFNIQKAINGLSSPNRERQSPFKWREDFTAKFEMAKSDEWFDINTIDVIEERIKVLEEIYYRSNNFGFYGRALLRMVEYFIETAQSKKPQFQHRLDILKEKYEEIENRPIVQVIQKSIDRLRFGEADSYLSQAERENFDIIDYNQLQERNQFEEFKNKYNMYYEQAKPESGLSLEKIFTQTHPVSNSEDYKSAVTFLKNWPHKGAPTTANIEAILRNVGQDKMLEKVVPKSADGYFVAKFNDKQDYNLSHPIAKFGSLMYENGLQIAVVQGSADLNDLFDDISLCIKKMDPTISALIIVDAAIHMSIRRQLAYKFMNTVTLISFIILDRVEALHIANEKKALRWPQLICCSVPFQNINPYSDESTKEIPNEMFFGRNADLQRIMNTETASIVFGGRQLGKTALLHHARNLFRDEKQGRWASWVDVKDKKVAEATQKIGDTLVTNPRERFFVGTKRSNWTWNLLINAIRERLSIGEDCKTQFFLFIDEADAFLKDSAKHNYRELDDLLQLSIDTNYRFRLVLAGLRDVVQFHRDSTVKNNIIANENWSKINRIRIPPLEFNDARRLLIVPLSYLGFTFSDEEDDVIAQILHSTNYFPGIIHFYAHKLIEQKHKTFNSASTPSFTLDRNDLLLLLKDTDFLKLRKNRLEITLELDDEDKYYYTLALLLSYYNNNERAEGKSEDYSQYGVTAQGLLKCAKEIDPTAKISKLTEAQITTVLEELYELYILKKTPDEDGIEYYDFARTAFADMLGRKDEVQTKLINLMAEGGHEND